MPVDYEIKVEQNTPLPEDETEEKTMDLSEVDSKVMSRKSYMKKWRNLTDDEVQEELEQIALERQIIEDATFGTGGSGGSEQQPYPDSTGGIDTGTEDDVADDVDDNIDDIEDEEDVDNIDDVDIEEEVM